MSEFENNNQYNQQENANPYQQENGTNGYSNPYYGNPSSAEEANSSNESSYYDKNAYGIVSNYGGYDKVPVKSGKGYAVASLILGIASITICCCVPGVGFICALLAIIFGVISQKRNPCGMALAGIITAAFGLVFGVIISASFAASWGEFIDAFMSAYEEALESMENSSSFNNNNNAIISAFNFIKGFLK